jgi:hypothetical protein
VDFAKAAIARSDIGIARSARIGRSLKRAARRPFLRIAGSTAADPHGGTVRSVETASIVRSAIPNCVQNT